VVEIQGAVRTNLFILSFDLVSMVYHESEFTLKKKKKASGVVRAGHSGRDTGSREDYNTLNIL